MRNGLVDYTEYSKMVQEAAYYRWLNGSLDTEANWYAAVAEVSSYNSKSSITEKLSAYYRESR